jgi:GxxExxY protein
MSNITNEKIIRDSANRVYDQLGYGLSENAYQTALANELIDLGFNNVQTEYHVSQYYNTSKNRQVQIADLRIDIIIDNKIILELKTIDGILEKKDKKSGDIKMNEISILKEYKQCERYKELKKINEAYLINFGKKCLEFIAV